MPSMSGWVLRGQAQGGGHRQRQRFYALDVGLGVARFPNSNQGWAMRDGFLCPRCRAGCCEGGGRLPICCSVPRFYALDVGLGVARPVRLHPDGRMAGVSMPSMSGWVLRAWPPSSLPDILNVSMPSMSGWVLRGDASFRCL